MRKYSWTLGLVVTAVAAGCGTDATTPMPNDSQLTAAEASFVADQTAELSYGALAGFLGGLGITGRPATDVNVQNAPFDVTRQCTFAGTVRKHGTVTANREGQFPNVSLSINASGTEAFNNCVMPTREGTSEDPVTVTINGQLQTTVTMKRENMEFVGVQTMTRNGTLTFATSDGRSGTCALNYTIQIHPAQGSRTVQGQLCNLPVNETRPLWRAGNGG